MKLTFIPCLRMILSEKGPEPGIRRSVDALLCEFFERPIQLTFDHRSSIV